MFFRSANSEDERFIDSGLDLAGLTQRPDKEAKVSKRENIWKGILGEVKVRSVSFYNLTYYQQITTVYGKSLLPQYL